MSDPTFTPAEWIGKGKKYIVEKLPDHVTDAKYDVGIFVRKNPRPRREVCDGARKFGANF